MDVSFTTWCQLTHLLKCSVGIQLSIVHPERHSCWQWVCISSHWQKGWAKCGLFTVEMFSHFHMFLEQILYPYILPLNIWTWLFPFIPPEFPFRPWNAKTLFIFSALGISKQVQKWKWNFKNVGKKKFSEIHNSTVSYWRKLKKHPWA